MKSIEYDILVQMEKDDNSGPNARKHKRARRKKLQANWQEKHLNDMCRQLERRYPNQPSTSSASSPIEMIPLPSESVEEKVPRELTAKDYEGVDYMKDPQVVSTHSAEIWRSLRVVRWAEDAERIMLAQANTTVDTVVKDFREKVLEKSLEKRRKQVDVPYIEYPLHRKDITADEVEDADTTVESNETMRQVSDISDTDSEKAPYAESSESSNDDFKSERKDVRKVKRKKTKEERFAEKLRQTNLTRQFHERKKKHPNAIHPDIQFNEKGLGNENPECRCPLETRTSGLRHGYYPGEDQPLDCTKE